MNQASLQKYWRRYLELRQIITRSDQRFINSYLGNNTPHRLTKEQSKAIQDYWRPLVGKKVSEKWHELIYTLSGHFTPTYLPLEVYNKIIAYNNYTGSYGMMSFLDDKCQYRYLLNGFNIPQRVVECCNGVWYLPEQEEKEVSRSQVIEYCRDLRNCIIKPSKNSSGGKRIYAFDGGGGNFFELITSYGDNFVIERKIKNNQCLSRLNPSSVNTLRFHTYRDRINFEILLLSCYIRIGRSGKIIDNASAGGIACAVSEDGKLNKNGVRCVNYEVFEATDSGITLDGYQIESFQQMKETVILAHSRLPYFGIIGWDVTIDESGRVIIIEYNPDPDLRIEQLIFNDTCLGDFQELVVKDMYNH